VTDLLMGAAEGMAYLRDIIAGRVAQPNSTRIRAILTALSMIGVPDLAHATIRDAMRECDAERGRPVSVTDQTASAPESLAAVKARIAATMGLTGQIVPGTNDAASSPRQEARTDGRNRCSALDSGRGTEHEHYSKSPNPP
jgi:hypothetical protein